MHGMSDALPIHVHAYEVLARAALSPAVRDYLAGGSDDERTLRGNREAFARLRFRPRVLVDVSTCDTTTSVLGTRVRSPVLIAPIAHQGLLHPEGECATARGAETAGTVFVASTMATRALEDIAAAAGPWWLQLYVFRDRAVTEALIQRAERSGCRAIVVTADAPRLGRRERDLRNGFAVPPPRDGAGASVHALLGQRVCGTSAIEVHARATFDPALTWDALAWIRARTSLPLVIKGIVTADDARLAVEHGAAAIVVSNHGGRQLDGTIATIDALPACVAAVDHRCEVYLDGGVRRGTDVLKALALGARAVLVGRPIGWALAVGGEHGVAHIVDLLRNELETAMCLAGCPDTRAIPRSLVC